VINIFKDQHYKGLSQNAAEAQAQLKKLLAYCPATGDFTWLVGAGRCKAGSKAGCLKSNSYVHITINGKLYLAHRLAWLYTHGEWPADMVDHIDRNPSNNGISNLRECSRSDNMRNVGLRVDNSSGFRGVSWNNQLGKFHARCV
jgi:hypothetical protein